MSWMQKFANTGWIAVAAAIAVLAPLSPGHKGGEQAAFAQPAGDAAIDERMAELRAFQARLRSTDYLERLAAFETGMASADPVVRQITIKEAFLADTDDLKARALRDWLSAHTSMIVQLTMPDRPSDKLKTAHERFLGDSFLLSDLSISEKDEIAVSFKRSGTPFAGQFVPGGFILIGLGTGLANSCELNLKVVDDTLMSGALRCPSLEPLPARVQIQ